jgi:hypothetical protein
VTDLHIAFIKVFIQANQSGLMAKAEVDELDGQANALPTNDHSKLSAAAAAQPLGKRMIDILNIVRGAKVDRPLAAAANGAPANQSSGEVLISSALDVLDQFQKQGISNPNDIVSPAFCLMFAGIPRIRRQAYQLLKVGIREAVRVYVGVNQRLLDICCMQDLIEKRVETVVNRLDDCLKETFFFVMRRFHQNIQLYKPIQASLLEAFAQIYAERFRNKRVSMESCSNIFPHEGFIAFFYSFQVTRENVMKGIVRQIETLASPEGLHRFVLELDDAALPDPVAVIEKTEGGEEREIALPKANYYVLLYLQFVSSVLTFLPYTLESEVLHAVYLINNFIGVRVSTVCIHMYRVHRTSHMLLLLLFCRWTSAWRSTPRAMKRQISQPSRPSQSALPVFVPC